MAPTDHWCSVDLSDTAAAPIHPSRSAPPVSYPVGRSFVCRVLLLGVTGMAVLMQTALWLSWGLPVGLSPAAWWVSSLVWALVLVGAWRGCLDAATGWLSWAPDTVGTCPAAQGGVPLVVHTGWWWSDGEGLIGQPVRRVQPTMVFDQWMLVRVTVAERANVPVWMWLEARTLPSRWMAWRRAVMAHGH